MKCITALWTAVLIFSSIFVNAQNTPAITGKLTDESQKPLQGITVSLQSAADTGTLFTTVTLTNGLYRFNNLPKGSYRVVATGVGYRSTSSSVFVYEGSPLELPVLTLAADIKTLNEVTVTARKPLFEQKPDKMVVNVDASPSNAGASALEVLEKSPGVTVDKDGNISLKGKAGVQVFIDGKPAYLSGNELTSMLRNMQGAQLDQIEIMTNPPAKYDAAGNSGIINIKTKKSKQRGYNGVITAGITQGRYTRTNESLQFNYRNNKVNVFTNLGYSDRKSFQWIYINRTFVDRSTKDVRSIFEQESDMVHRHRSFNGKIGMDYFASRKTTLGWVLNGFSNPSTFRNTSDIRIYDHQMQPLGFTTGKVNNREKWQNFSTNFNLRHVFDSTGKEITADLDYIHYNGLNAQMLNNYYFDASQNVSNKADTLLGHLPQQIHIYSAKVDYVHPLKKGAKWEAGLKSSYVATDNNARYDSVVNNIVVPDIYRSNHFVYQEQINAGYVNYSRPLSKKWSAQLGLRLENTLARGTQRTTGEKFTRNYTQLFPTAFLQYTPGEQHSFQINYGRRIRRPDYSSLNPFMMFLDRYTFEQGNPLLQPQFSQNIELSHTWKGFLTTTLNYTRTNNIIQQVLEQNELTNETYITQANIASQRQYGVSVSAFKQVKNFGGNVFANLYNNLFKGLINNQYAELGATTLILNGNVNYRFGKGYTAELGGFYRTAGVEGVFRIQPLGMLNVGLSKNLFNNKGTLRLNVRDLLWTQNASGRIDYGLVNVYFRNRNDSRTATLSFSYRFGKGKVNGAPKRRTGGASDEESRVKTGNSN